MGTDSAKSEVRSSGRAYAEVALWAADERAKAGFVAALDGEVQAHPFHGCGEFVRIIAHDFEIRQAALLGSVLGGVNRVGAPFDEEGQKAVAVVGKVDGFPSEDAAVRALSGAVCGAREGDFVFAELIGDGSDVRRMDGPADEARVGHGAELRVVDDFALLRVRSDDFQVAALAEREECIAGAAAGMDSADGGADADVLFDKFDAAIEIVAAEKDVIEQCGHLVVIFLARRPVDGRRHNRASGQSKKAPARNHSWHLVILDAGLGARCRFQGLAGICGDSSACRAGVDFALEGFDKFGEGLGAEVAFAAMANGDGAGFGFLGADDQHVGNFLELRVADFGGQLFVAVVEMRAEIVALQSFSDVLGVVGDFFADRADFHLHRREPQREGAGIVLDQDAEEALDGDEQRAVHHERLMLGAVFADVLQAEARGEIEIELHSGELPGTADRVDELDVDFRAVERAFAYHLFERNVHALHGVSKSGCSAVPVFGLAGVVFRMRGIPIGELDFEFVEAEIFHHGKGEIDAGFDFGFNLRGHAENVRVVLGEAADAQQTVEHAAALVAIDSAKLGKTDGKVPVAVQLCFVNQNVAGAIHGLELVLGLFDFHRAEHAVFVKIGVAAGLPEVEAHDVWGVDEVVAALKQLFAQPVFDNFSNQAAFGVPENQPGAGFFLNAEEVEFRAQPAVIAALGFLDAVKMRVQFFLREEGHRVNALKLGIPFLALPVSAGDVHQLERLDALGRGNVRAAAEVDEFSGGVEGDHRLGGFFFDKLALKNLVGLFVEVQGFRLGNELAFVGQILRGKLVHLFFDFGEVFLGERLIAQEFVEKAGVDRRTDAELHAGIEFHHRGGEEMRRGMTKHEERIRIFFREDLQLHIVIQRAAQVDQFAFAVVGRGDARHQRRIRQPRRNTSGDVGRSRSFGDFFDAAIRQRDVNRFHLRAHLEGETSSLSAGSTVVKPSVGMGEAGARPARRGAKPAPRMRV